MADRLTPWVAEAERRLPILRAQIPEGRWARWRWKRRRQKFEYELFSEGGAYGSWAWLVVKEENTRLGVWSRHLEVTDG